MAIDPIFESDEIKLTELIRGFREYGWFLIKRSWLILIITLVMVYLGMWFARTSDKNWIANASFNAIDAKGGMGGLMSLASTFGINAGGGTTNDVLMGIFSSRFTFKSSMLTEVPYKKRMEKIGNIYLEISGMSEDFKKDPAWKNFKFIAPDIYHLSEQENMLLSNLYDAFADEVVIFEIDPLVGLIKAQVVSTSYDFSLNLCEKMLENTANFYNISASQKALDGYLKMRSKVDSLSGVLRTKQALLANLNDQNIFNRKEQGITRRSELMRDLGILNMQYSDAVTSLESTKGSLGSQTQVVRVVDAPRYSMFLDQRKESFWGLIGGLVGALVTILILCIVKASKDAFKEEEEAKKSTMTVL
jgi:uncharacterized membrane protein